jgi:hypothetical protein
MTIAPECAQHALNQKHLQASAAVYCLQAMVQETAATEGSTAAKPQFLVNRTLMMMMTQHLRLPVHQTPQAQLSPHTLKPC